MIRFLLIILIFFGYVSSQAQLSDSSAVYLLTCRPGDDPENLFGHTAIQIIDQEYEKNEIYNYGLFSFDQPNFVSKFLRGKLLYSLGIQSQAGFEHNYHSQKRSVVRQKLNYTIEQKNNIYKTLRENYKKENRDYLYDFFFDNCSTRPRDILLNTTPGVSENNFNEGDKTFRNLLDEFTYPHPWTDFGIDLIIGKIADKKSNNRERMFLPQYLYTAVKKADINGQKLEERDDLLVDYEGVHRARQHRPFFTPVLFFGLLLLIELLIFLYGRKRHFGLVKIYDKVWYLVLGISGLIILFMWFGTDHIATKQNLNAIWLNPLFFLIVIISRRWINILLIGCLCAALLVAALFQEFHVAGLIIICTTLLRLIRNIASSHNANLS